MNNYPLRPRTLVIRCTAVVMLLCLALALFACATPQPETPPQPVLHSFKANLHTHTNRSDGDFTPAEMVAKYQALGYDFLALSDHLITTYPWSQYDIPQSNMGTVNAMEVECVVAHVGVLFATDFPGVGAVDSILQQNRAGGGLAILNHPGRYDNSLETVVDWYLNNDNLFAMEIVNRNNRYEHDVEFYDTVLSEVMPQRMIYSVASDDAHDENDIGWSYTVFRAERNDADGLRAALDSGNFYCVSRGTVENPVGTPPSIDSVTVENGVATISGKDYQSVRWISLGAVVSNTNSVSLAECEKYVRAELVGAGGIAYSQPIAIAAQA